VNIEKGVASEIIFLFKLDVLDPMKRIFSSTLLLSHRNLQARWLMRQRCRFFVTSTPVFSKLLLGLELCVYGSDFLNLAGFLSIYWRFLVGIFEYLLEFIVKI
jgi:hypothetical protein